MAETILELKKKLDIALSELRQKRKILLQGFKRKIEEEKIKEIKESIDTHDVA